MEEKFMAMTFQSQPSIFCLLDGCPSRVTQEATLRKALRRSAGPSIEELDLVLKNG